MKLDEQDIIRHCDSRVLRRARTILRAADAVYSRSCRREIGSTSKLKIRARVSDGQDRNRCADVTVAIDEAAGQVKQYECTCQEALHQSGMCKHAVAVCLEFLRGPDSFSGFDQHVGATSSPGVLKLIKSLRHDTDASEHDAQVAPSAKALVRDGAIHLEPLLTRDGDSWSLRLRIGNGHVRYVVKDLVVLLDCVRCRRYHSYGERLGFLHEPAAFDEWSLSLMELIAKCLDIRRELEQDRLSALSVRPTELRGEFALSTPELVELLELCDDENLYVEDLGESGHKLTRTHVISGNPSVRIIFDPDDDNGYSIISDKGMGILAYSSRFYVWFQHMFYLCDSGFERCEGFLRLACCGSPSYAYIASADVRGFCALLLPTLEEELEVVVPEQMAALRPVPCRIEFYLDYADRSCLCRAQAVYGEERFALFSPADEADSSELRDSRSEGRARRVLHRYFPVVEGVSLASGEKPLKLSDPGGIARLLYRGIAQFNDLGDVYTTSAFDSLVSHRKVQVSYGLSLKSDLIDLHVSSDDLDGAELAAVLSSYRQRLRYHRLPDGRFLDLADQDLDALVNLVDEMGIDPMDIVHGSVTFEPYRAFALDALVDDADKDRTFRSFIRRAKSDGQTRHSLPTHLRGVMRPYQIEGFNWLNSLADNGFAGVLADEMGLGKSLQLISFLCQHHAQGTCAASLIICPASLVYNWVAEFEKFSGGMRVEVIAGPRDARSQLLGHLSEAQAAGAHQPDIIITSYDLLKRDIEDYEELSFFCAALDEAQYIKNPHTQAALCVKRLHAEHRFALTGTPVENRLSELWSIFDFLMPGLLGSAEKFRETYELPILGGDTERLDKLRELIGHFVLRRLKADVLDDLPSKSEVIVPVQMVAEQKTLYSAREQQLRESLCGKRTPQRSNNRIVVLAELMRLRELCCDPRLVYEDYGGPSAKLDCILELIESARDSGAKSLVFSQFTSFLDLIAQGLQQRGIAYYMITGATPKLTRVELVEAFNGDDTPVFLVSLKAGGTGLNLTGASVVIHADPWWNSAAEDQATDRSHRIGQTKDVTVYKIIAKETIEERVVALQEAKSELADKLVGSISDIPSTLTTEDLVALLSD